MFKNKYGNMYKMITCLRRNTINFNLKDTMAVLRIVINTFHFRVTTLFIKFNKQHCYFNL